MVRSSARPSRALRVTCDSLRSPLTATPKTGVGWLWGGRSTGVGAGSGRLCELAAGERSGRLVLGTPLHAFGDRAGHHLAVDRHRCVERVPDPPREPRLAVLTSDVGSKPMGIGYVDASAFQDLSHDVG